MVGSVFEFNEGLLHPFMGLLSVDRPDDPWRRKAFDPHHALYSGGGSYAAYLKDARRRRDTHIMGQTPTSSLLTPGMLERLLRIKMEFQRRFPHLYKGMVTHHANQTRVEVKPPVLTRISSPPAEVKKKPILSEEPVFELGAAERNVFEEAEEEEDPLEKDPVQEPDEDDQDEGKQEESKEEAKGRDRKNQDDNDIDYFSFVDDDVDD